MTTSLPERPRILIADDSSSSIKLCTTILSKEYEVISTTQGGEVVEMARSTQPHLILLDVVMPHVDGYEIFARLQADQTTHAIPVIFVTANTQKSDETRGLGVGAVDYIVKPFDPHILLVRVRTHLKRERDKQTIQRLLHQNELILNAAGEGIYGVDRRGLITFINTAAYDMLGWEAGALIGQSAHALLHYQRTNGTPYPETECPTYAAAHGNVVTRNNSDLFWRKDGTGFPVEYISTPIVETDARSSPDHAVISGVVVVFRDISQQKLLETREVRSQISRIAISALLETSLAPLSLSEQLHVALQIILSVSWLSTEYKGSIFLVDDTKQDTLVMAAQLGLSGPLNDLCREIPFGYCLCGRAAQQQNLVFASHIDSQHDITFDGMQPHGHYCVPIFFQTQVIGVLNLYLPHNHTQTPEEDAFVVTIANTLAGIIVRRKLELKLEESQKELNYLARHDKLTGLPNRMLFQEQLQHNMLRARRDRAIMAVLFIDLDRFKYVNDTYGHEVGDLLLVQVSQAIQNLLREVDTVARMGGDEFTVILCSITQEQDATLVAEKIISCLQRPFIIQGHSCEIGASIGISLFPTHADNAEALLKTADAAMYRVKEKGRNNYVLYQPGMETNR